MNTPDISYHFEHVLYTRRCSNGYVHKCHHASDNDQPHRALRNLETRRPAVDCGLFRFPLPSLCNEVGVHQTTGKRLCGAHHMRQSRMSYLFLQAML